MREQQRRPDEIIRPGCPRIAPPKISNAGRTTELSAAKSSATQTFPDRSGPPRRRTNKVPRAAPHRDAKVNPRIAWRIHNPSPFVQTHAGLARLAAAYPDNPALSRLEMA